MHEFETWTMHNGVSVSRVGRDQYVWTSLVRAHQLQHWQRRGGKCWAFNEETLALAEAGYEQDMINVPKRMKSSHLAEQNHAAIH